LGPPLRALCSWLHFAELLAQGLPAPYFKGGRYVNEGISMSNSSEKEWEECIEDQLEKWDENSTEEHRKDVSQSGKSKTQIVVTTRLKLKNLEKDYAELCVAFHSLEAQMIHDAGMEQEYTTMCFAALDKSEDQDQVIYKDMLANLVTMQQLLQIETHRKRLEAQASRQYEQDFGKKPKQVHADVRTGIRPCVRVDDTCYFVEWQDSGGFLLKHETKVAPVENVVVFSGSEYALSA
jgi:hypothetical protein